MILTFEDILPPESVRDIRAAFERIAFRDGRASAGAQAVLVKNNEQAIPGDAEAEPFRKMIADTIFRHPEFRLAARPLKLSSIMLSRYKPGMSYGAHVDHPISGGGEMRRDISFTLFLNDPHAYDGGALVIMDGAGELEIKLPAGSMVIYPSTTLHRVEEVTRGERLAAVGWAQSMVRDAKKREILYDLNVARLDFFEHYGKSKNSDLLAKAAANLLQMWADV
ncbi:Fe2+-dependent dioxygenase [Marinicaulis aureus]|uniref:Fe2+-dependent dioxygenase n=1 Tax=Hyphococcus aureus TaxID=2666033 RepID=A0ABW1KRL9_9PROT